MGTPTFFQLHVDNHPTAVEKLAAFLTMQREIFTLSPEGVDVHPLARVCAGAHVCGIYMCRCCGGTCASCRNQSIYSAWTPRRNRTVRRRRESRVLSMNRLWYAVYSMPCSFQCVDTVG